MAQSFSGGESLPEDLDQVASEALPPLKSIGGVELKQLFTAGTAWLEKHSAYVNSLNVFPVPDGDSGTNMLLTMQAALKEVNSSPTHSAAAVCAALSQGALLGARGNSGVILSQIIRGFSRAVEKHDSLFAKELAAAMEEGSRTAYKGVVKPVEGTILTVCREAATATSIAASQTDDIRIVLLRTLEAARMSLLRTPSLLPVLQEAGVVDAGGQGLVFILEGALKYLRGEPMDLTATGPDAQALERLVREEGWGFDIQFHVRGTNLDVDGIRERVAAMGESALVVGDMNLIKVHVHAPSPGAILDYGCSLGALTNILVENMQEQYVDFMAGQASRHLAVTETKVGITTIAVAGGPGLARVFQSLGVGAVVSGGQTMNPSTEDILRAIESVATDQVIVLPNNKNIIPAADQAKTLTKKKVTIVPTKTIPEGIAALLAFNFQSDLTTNTQAMARAAQNIQTAEITTATRSVNLDGIQVVEGQTIGLVNGALKVTASSPAQTALDLIEGMRPEDHEIITLYYGEETTDDEARALADQIRSRYPSQEIEVLNGGQPHYHYIISLE